MTAPVLEYQSAHAAPERPPLYWYERAYLLLAGVVLPIGCFAASADRYPLAEEWQSGAWHATLSQVPSGRCAWPFYPLLACAMLCIALLAVRPIRFAPVFAVRFGLYTGILLALQFTCIQAIAMTSPDGPGEAIVACAVGIAAAGAPIFVGWLISLVPWRRMFDAGRRHVAPAAARSTLLTVVAVGVLLVILLAGLANVAITALFVALAGAPALTLAAYAWASRVAWTVSHRSDEEDEAVGHLRWIAPVAWLAMFVGAWRLSMAAAVAEYAKLPTSAPGCYVATAAARGHRRFVRSRLVRDDRGGTFAVNEQLRRLKCAEILLRASSPELHRHLRRAYDHIGPRLARFLGPPLAADVAYVLLKPIEGLALVLLRAALPDDTRRHVAAAYAGGCVSGEADGPPHARRACNICASQ